MPGSPEVAIQADRLAKMMFDTLAFIGTGIEYKTRDIMMQLYKSLVRQHNGVLCAILSTQDIITLERVQKRLIRVLPELVGLTYRVYRLGCFHCNVNG